LFSLIQENGWRPGAPAIGYTPSVNVLGSDEKRAEQRQPRRWVRRWRRSLKPELLSSSFIIWERQSDSKTGCIQLLTGISFGKRLWRQSCVLWRCRAAGLVSAATWLTSLLTWRAGEDARSRSEIHRSHKKHGGHGHRNYDPAQHWFSYTTS